MHADIFSITSAASGITILKGAADQRSRSIFPSLINFFPSIRAEMEEEAAPLLQNSTLEGGGWKI